MEVSRAFDALAGERAKKRADVQGSVQFVQVSDYVSPGGGGQGEDGGPGAEEIALARAIFAAAAGRVIEWRGWRGASK